jgi:hypothetical protein
LVGAGTIETGATRLGVMLTERMVLGLSLAEEEFELDQRKILGWRRRTSRGRKKQWSSK